MRHQIAAAVLACIVLAMPARANDSEAAIGLGGIELVANRNISMDSEDLYISEREVRVRYRYTNHSDRDLELIISFPMPVETAEAARYGEMRSVPGLDQLGFRTTVDGTPVKFEVVKRAELAGKDVTVRLAHLGWPMEWSDGSGEIPAFVARLSPAERSARLAEGLLVKEGANYFPAWDIATHVIRKQVFPAGRSVEVVHRYVPVIGGSVAGALDPQVRRQYPEHLQTYCVDKSFLAAFDRKAASRGKGEQSTFYSETWISYVLSSGRNWRGPIGDFRLVVDKGRPESLVSFCMDGVRKISPTQFEVRRTNYEPQGDLDILIVNWPAPDS